MTTKTQTQTPGPRCSDCQWVHEADSIAKASFMGVGLCPLHAAAPELLGVLKGIMSLPGINENNPWAMGARAAIAKAEGR